MEDEDSKTKKLISLIESVTNISNEQKQILIGIYAFDKNEAEIAKEKGMTRQEISRKLLGALEKLERNPKFKSLSH